MSPPPALPAPYARERFARLAALPGDDVPLVPACVAIALEEYPTLDAARCDRQLAELVSGAREAVGAPTEDRARLERLNLFLFGREGFRGNTEEYDDPRNSFWNDVLERRTGLPITLSVLYLEIAGQLGVPMVGVGLPGHFVVRTSDERDPVYVDPFHGGTFLTERDCRSIAAKHLGGVAIEDVDRAHLQPMSSRRILLRVLTNLKRTFIEKDDHGKALACAERALLLHPDSAWDLRDRGLLYLRAGCLPMALATLRQYVSRHAALPDVVEIEKNLAGIAAMAYPVDRFVRPLRVRREGA